MHGSALRKQNNGVQIVESFSFDLEQGAASYLTTDGGSASSRPLAPDLNISAGKCYRVTANARFDGSVTLCIYLFESELAAALHLPLAELAERSFVLYAGDSYCSARVSLRLAKSGEVQSFDLALEELEPHLEQVCLVDSFNHYAGRRSAPLAEYYMEALVSRGLAPSDCSVSEIYPVEFDALQSYSAGAAVNSAPGTPFDLFPDFMQLANSLARHEIVEYRVQIIPSGVGDILIVGSAAAYLCEQLGLRFVGVENHHAGSKRPYYGDLLTKLAIGFSSTEKRADTLYWPIQDVRRGIDELLQFLERGDIGPYRSLCFQPDTPQSFAAIRDLWSYRKDVLDTAFGQWFRSKNIKHVQEAIHEPVGGRLSVTLHLRLGDVAPILVGESTFIPTYVVRRDFASGISIGRDDESPAYSQLLEIERLASVAKRLKDSSWVERVVLVSDGYDLCESLVCNEEFVGLLAKGGIATSVQLIGQALDEAKAKLASFPADELLVGETSADQFFESIAAIAGADIVLSSARSFCFTALAFFRSSTQNRAFLYSEKVGSHFDALSSRNVSVNLWRPADTDLEEVVRRVTMAQFVEELKRPEPPTSDSWSHLSPPPPSSFVPPPESLSLLPHSKHNYPPTHNQC